MKYIKSFNNYKIIINESFEFNDNGLILNNNRPINFYHGGSYNNGEFKGLAWFTTNKNDAKYYVNQSSGFLTKANLVIRNPLYSGDIKKLNIELSDDIINSAKKRNLLNFITYDENKIIEFIETNAAILIAIDLGRDGVIDLYNNKIVDVVVFSDKQIIIIN